MKIIHTMRGYRIAGFDSPSEEVTADLLKKIMDPVDRNRAEIIISAQTIEDRIDIIITNHFFKDRLEKTERFEFENQILKSDWCTFSSKIRLLLYIIEEKPVIDKREKTNFEKILRKSMEYRNAFTHGDFVTDGREVRINYFKSKPIEKVVDDAWLTEIESNMKECIDYCFKISELLRKQP